MKTGAMASKSTLNQQNLAALGAERLTDLLMEISRRTKGLCAMAIEDVPDPREAE